MNSRGEVTTGTIILSAVGIIFATVLIIAIAQNQGTATTLLLAYNESDTPANCWNNVTVATQVNQSRAACNITVDRNTTGEWQYAGCPLTNVVMRNSTNSTAVLNTDYRVFSNVVALQNTTFWYNNTLGGNITYLDYNFCPVGYNTDAGARNIAGLWTLFSVLALLAFVLAYIGWRQDWFDF